MLDATKIVPEELVPVVPVGRLVLNRNPDNFFAETEQVAFCTAHVVPGIDFTNDPLLAGRIHSYVDTQISRLGGPNFHEIPINAPLAQVHNNQRDGMHRQAIHRGRVAYEPNSLGGGCPFQAGAAGFVSFPEPMEPDAHKVRGKAERFADHYTQATLFWNSQTPVEKTHIINAFRFELSRVQTPAVRERMVSGLMNVAPELAEAVAAGLGMRQMPAPMPKVLQTEVTPEVDELAGAVAVRASRRRQRPRAPRGHPRRRRRRRRRAASASPSVWSRPARCRGSSARGSGVVESVNGDPIEIDVADGSGAVGPVRRRRPAGRRGRRSAPGRRRPGAGVREGSVPALQADPGARRGLRAAGQGGHPADAAVWRARSGPACSDRGRQRDRGAGLHRGARRSIDTSIAKPIRRVV